MTAASTEQAGEDAMREALHGSGHCYADAEWAQPPGLPRDVLIYLALRTDTAWRVDIAKIVLDELCHRLPLATATVADMRTAIHEAVVNAVVHGNLAVPNTRQHGLEGLRQFHAQIDARLAEPALARRRVLIVVRHDRPRSLRIEISDQGDGFVSATALGAFPPLEQTHGRGLALIVALASECRWLRTRRTLQMRFPLLTDARAC